MQRFILCIALFFMMAGCAPKLTPTLAVREVEQSAALDKAASAKVGESLIAGLDMFAYQAYSPREFTAIPVPDGIDMQPLSPDQNWIAFYQLDDGTLVVEAPDSLTREDVRLGLRIDKDGRVVGNRPWFDLRAKTRLNQLSWSGLRRYLFRVSGKYLMDVFTFDLKYVGKGDRGGVFDLRDFKAVGVKSVDARRIVIAPGKHFVLHGLDIRIVEVYADHVRYVVAPAR